MLRRVYWDSIFIVLKVLISYILLAVFINTAFPGCRSEDDHNDTTPVTDITRGLVAYWSFDNDPGATVKDESVNKLDGTGTAITYETGVSGMAARFNDAQAKIIFPAAGTPPPVSISGLATGSVSVWFKYQNLGAQILPIFYFGESDTGTPHNSLIIEVGHGGGTNPSNKRLYFTIVNRSFCYDSNFNLLENNWYHFVAVVSSSGNTGYLNGVEMTNRKYNLGSNARYTDFFSNVPVRELLSIGYGRYGQEDPFFSFSGCIDEVRIYDRPLNADEVNLLYQVGQ